jgi:hypothetical protein
MWIPEQWRLFSKRGILRDLGVGKGFRVYRQEALGTICRPLLDFVTIP